MQNPRMFGLPALLIAATGQAAMAQGVVWSNAIGTPGVNAGGVVSALHVSSIEGSPRLYAGGLFTSAGGIAVTDIATWNGTAWSAVAGGLSMPTSSGLVAIDTVDLGTGPRLYVSGGFWYSPPSVPALARLEGAAWSPVAGGLNAPNTWIGFMRRVGTAGSAALWVSGGFTNYLAAWDGSTWSVPGGGLSSVIHDAASFDDGSGEQLYITGSFPTAGGLQVRQFARWNGTAFSAAAGGISGVGYALAVWDDGRGPALYLGGQFTAVGMPPQHVQAMNIARWDGRAWEPLGAGVNSAVRGLAVYDDGGGPKLYATGQFTAAGGASAQRIARWDGHTWSALGAGLTGAASGDGGRVLEVFDADGNGPSPSVLVVGGAFTMAGGQSAGGIAALRPCRAEVDGDCQLGVSDIFAYLALWFAGDSRAEFDGVSGIGIPDIFAFLGAWFAGCG